MVHLIESNALNGAGSSGEAAGSDAAGGPGPASSGSSGESAETTALQFVAAHLAANRAVVPPSIVMRVLDHLAAPAQPPGAAGGGSGGSNAQRAVWREGVFRDVVTHALGALSEVDRQQVRVWGKELGGTGVWVGCGWGGGEGQTI